MRNLTTGEVAMLQGIFGNSINYNQVYIAQSNLDRGITLENTIVMPFNEYFPDYNENNQTVQALFLHEMTHVWQWQQGYPTPIVGFGLQLMETRYTHEIFNPYDYGVLDKTKSFGDFNMEQQGQLMQDYFDGADKNPELSRIVRDFINSDHSNNWLPNGMFTPYPNLTDEQRQEMARLLKAGVLEAGLYGPDGPPQVGDPLYDLYKATRDWWKHELGDISDTVNSLWEQARNWIARRDPLVLDLDGDGIETVGVNATTHILFDHNNDGVKTGTGWIKGDDGFVVLDRNGNGTIDNGGELFGDQTLVNGAKATDGFAALSAEDTNHNGKFDAGDTNFTNVRIWQDTNSDGISQAGELHTLNELGITSINLTSTTSNTVSNGNVQIAKGTFTKTNGTTGDSGTLNLTEDTGNAGNLNFSQNPFYSEFTDHLTLTDTALALPDMQGSGMVRVNNQNFRNTRKAA